MRAGTGVAWLIACIFAATAANAASPAPPMQIKFAEAIDLPAVTGQTEFDAYGRRFALTLESNARLLKKIPATQKATLGESRVLRGHLDNVPGSWVRLTRVGNGIEGAIWDGNDVYVVTRYGSIVGKLTTPLVAAPDQTVVYRLSDTLNGLPPEFCGAAPGVETAPAGSALKQYKSLVSELRADSIAPTDELDIALIADTDFQTYAGANATDLMLARLNVVDGIYNEQLGVVIAPTEFRLVPANADPFTKTDASTLLDQVAAYRENTPSVRTAGLAHLMTGKNLDSNIIGIAFYDSLCKVHEGVSLGDSEEGEVLSALVMAHEIGHNFGARHDGDPGVCATTPQTFLMAPAINGSSQFSACSLNSMRASIAAARGICIGTPNYVDLEIGLPPSPYAAQTNGTFSLPITVRSNGNLPATHVKLQVTFPAYFQMASASLAGNTCTFADEVANCTLADFAAGEDRTFDLRVTGNSLGSYPVKAVVSTDNDRLESNNTAEVQLGIQSGVDLGVTVATSASSIFVTDAVDYTVDVTSHGTLTSHGGNLYINIGGIPIESFTNGPHACAIDSQSNWILTCQLADVAAGASTRITIRGRPDQARVANGAIFMNVPNDSNPDNNNPTMRVNVSAQREVRMSVSTQELRAVVGNAYELTYTLAAFGRQPSQNVRLSLQQPTFGVIDSVLIDGVTCSTDPAFTNCDFGTLNPGDTRTAVVRFHMTASFTSSMSASTRWSNGAIFDFSSTYTWIYANLTIDVAAAQGGILGSIDEDVIGEAGFNVETKGVNPAQSVTATLELAPPLRLLSLRYDHGPSGWTCELLTPQRGRCTGSFAGGSLADQLFAVMYYTFSSPTAVDGQATLTVGAAGDGDPTNNVSQITLPIKPYVDIGLRLSGSSDERLLITGQTTTVDATIVTGKNPVPGARINPWASDASLALDSFSVGGIDCSQTPSGGSCALGTLPANSAIPVRAVFHGVAAEGHPYAVLDVYPDRDSNNTNNHLAIQLTTLGMSDLRVRVGAASVTATNGAALNFPHITVTNGTATQRDVSVDIPLPPFVTLSSVSSPNGFVCSGTATLHCTLLSGLAANNEATMDLYLNAIATGTFTSNVVVHGFNDSTADNNTATAVITVDAAPPVGGGGSSSSGGGTVVGGASGGGGGGGRIEWLVLALLGALTLRRIGVRPHFLENGA